MLVLDHCFDAIRLHRLEANIQPGRERSIALVRGLGVGCEGYAGADEIMSGGRFSRRNGGRHGTQNYAM
ncbi:MAG: hypothetical protein EA426_15360 [Spirochaetaceae bacterium]|nr:MAG: hypothetical protein EA426_15360 [Spirochaetaceae bacterium]